MKKQPENKQIRVILSVADRISFPMIAPLRGSRIENALSQTINKRIDFSPEERQSMAISTMAGNTVWDTRKEKTKEFLFEPHEILLIQQGINQRDYAGLLTNNPHVNDLVERLMSIKIEGIEPK